MKRWDIGAYWILVALMIVYAAYIKTNCEELGCLAIIVPILGVFILSGLEFLVSLAMYFKKGDTSLARKVTIGISGVGSLFALVAMVWGAGN